MKFCQITTTLRILQILLSDRRDILRIQIRQSNATFVENLVTSLENAQMKNARSIATRVGLPITNQLSVIKGSATDATKSDIKHTNVRQKTFKNVQIASH